MTDEKNDGNRSPDRIIENVVDDYEKLNSSTFHLRPFWDGLGPEVVHALREAGYTISKTEVFPAVDQDKERFYTFQSYLQEILREIDSDISVTEGAVDKLDIRVAGSWHIATVQAPAPTSIFSAWFMQYPREIQTEVFRRVIFGINSWCRLATDTHTGKVIE